MLVSNKGKLIMILHHPGNMPQHCKLFALEVVHGDHVVAAGHDKLVGGGRGGGGCGPSAAPAAPSSARRRPGRSVRRACPPWDIDVVDARYLAERPFIYDFHNISELVITPP